MDRTDVAVEETLYCSRCEEWKSSTEFHRNGARPSGYCNHCKACRALVKRRPETVEQNRRRSRETGRAQRQEVIQLLGGKCVRCGFDDWRALQVDHAEGDGWSEKQSFACHAAMARDILRRLRAGQHLDRYQLLCCNCNWIKRHEEQEYRPGRERIRS